jgi:hypothetical protein
MKNIVKLVREKDFYTELKNGKKGVYASHWDAYDEIQSEMDI